MKLSGMLARRILTGSMAGAAATVTVAACSSASNSSPGPTVTITTPAPSAASGPASAPASPPASPPVSVPVGGAGGTGGVAAGAQPCTTAGLHVGTGSSQGAAGTNFTRIVFTNTSGSACALGGFPGVSLVTSAGHAGSQIGAAARRTSTSPPRTVTLRAGQAAHAVLGVTVAGNFPAGKCRPVNAHWLKVFPPNQRAAVYAPLATMTCASASVRTLTISPVRTGP